MRFLRNKQSILGSDIQNTQNTQNGQNTNSQVYTLPVSLDQHGEDLKKINICNNGNKSNGHFTLNNISNDARQQLFKYPNTNCYKDNNNNIVCSFKNYCETSVTNTNGHSVNLIGSDLVNNISGHGIGGSQISHMIGNPDIVNHVLLATNKPSHPTNTTAVLVPPSKKPPILDQTEPTTRTTTKEDSNWWFN